MEVAAALHVLSLLSCSVKPSGTLLSMLKTAAGRSVRKEDKRWQGTFIVCAPYNN